MDALLLSTPAPFCRALSALEDADDAIPELSAGSLSLASGEGIGAAGTVGGGASGVRSGNGGSSSGGGGGTDQGSRASFSSPGAPVPSRPLIRFKTLYEALASWGLSSDPEPAILLLYRLLHSCPAFSDYTLSRTDMDVLLLPLLRLVYECPVEASSYAHTLQVGRPTPSTQLQLSCCRKSAAGRPMMAAPWHGMLSHLATDR